MVDLYLERIGLARPTIVLRNNDGEIERLESRGLDIASLVAFWRRCFDLDGLLFEKITLHCKSKDFNAMSQRTLAACRSVREIFAEQGVECVIDDEWFKDREVKNAVEEFAEKLKAKAHSVVGFDVRKRVYAKEYTINEIDINEVLKEYKKNEIN